VADENLSSQNINSEVKTVLTHSSRQVQTILYNDSNQGIICSNMNKSAAKGIPNKSVSFKQSMQIQLSGEASKHKWYA
jgi:hypothetical protein